MNSQRLRSCLAVAAASIGLGLGIGACGGGDSAEASVGDCIDAANEVVDCGSSQATKKLVSDQSEPDAIACVAIGEVPQTEVEVDGTTFCAEDL
jgi:hypothetical protein